LYKTQCVAIAFGGNATAMSGIKQIAVWNLKTPGTTSIHDRVQFDDGLRSWHVPSSLALIRDCNDDVMSRG